MTAPLMLIRRKKMQREVNRFSLAFDNFGLTIRTTKTEVMYMTILGKPYHEPCITVKGQKLYRQWTDSHTWAAYSPERSIRSIYTKKSTTGSPKPVQPTDDYSKNMWEHRGLSTVTKLYIVIYCAVVLTTMLHASATWTVYSRHAKQLNHLHMNCLCRILRIKWQDEIPDFEVLEVLS